MPNRSGPGLRVLVDDSAAVHQGAGIGRYARNVVRAAITAGGDIDWVLAYAAGRVTPPFLDEAFDGLMPSPFDDSGVHAQRAGGEQTSPPAPLRLPDRFVTRRATATHRARRGESLPGLGITGHDRVDVRRLPLSDAWATRLWHRARVPLPIQLLARRRADIVYSPDLAVAPSGRVPRVPTIHDLAFLVHPELYPPRLLAYLRAVTDRQIAAAAHVVTVSESSRTDLMERAGVAPDRVSIVPNGVDGRFLAARPPDASLRARLGLPGDYLLTVGSIEPRKNHLALFAALDALPPADRLPLVVAGRAGWGNRAIMAELRRREGLGQVVFLPGIADADLPALYAGAAVMVYPARYEGFGIPVIEALAAGAPVVVNDTPALREAAGPHGIVADASDPAALAAAIGTALSGQMQDAGRQVWARRWSWDRSGELLVEVLSRVGRH